MIKKLAGIFVIFVLLVLLIAGAFAVMLNLFSGSARLKQAMLYGIRGYCGREAAIGSFSAGILSGVQMTDFALSEYPDMKAGTFLSVKSVSFKPRFFSFLQQHVSIGEVLIEEPVVSIARNKDGSFNYENIINRSAPRRYAPWPLFISRLGIRDCTVSFSNGRGAAFVLEDIFAEARNISVSEPFDVLLSLRIPSAGSDVTLKIKAIADIRNQKIDIIDARDDSGAIVAKGCVSNFSENGGPDYEFQISGDKTLISRIIRSSPALRLINMGGSRRISFTISGNRMKTKISKVTLEIK